MKCQQCNSRGYIINTRKKPNSTYRRYACAGCSHRWSSFEIHLVGERIKSDKELPYMLRRYITPPPEPAKTLNMERIEKLLAA